MLASRRAFTLIELLVVIAIIAILAAILFPVFAQAKAAAKAAASISNAKQIALAALIYSPDYDDYAPLDQSFYPNQWNASMIPLDGKYVASWMLLIQPYMKNLDLLRDPAGPNWRVRTERSWSPAQSQTYMPSYGYNYSAFSPQPLSDWPTVPKPTSMTGVEKPAETVMFTASMMQWVDSSFAFYYPGGNWLSAGLVDPVYADWNVSLNGGGWGQNYNWQGLIQSANDDTNGSVSGGVSMRVARMGVFSFSDGHTKRMPLTSAARGTNWNPNLQNYQVVITDVTQYMWDIK